MNAPQLIDGSGEVAVKGGAGARRLSGRPAAICVALALIWIAIQFAAAFDVPAWLRAALGADQTIALGWQRMAAVHLLFALALSAFAFPLFAASRRDALPAYDWLLVLLALLFAAYLAFLNARGGVPVSGIDLTVLVGGTGLLGLAIYRAAGLPLLIVTVLIGFYLFFGDRPFMPDAVRWTGVRTANALERLWVGTEGILGRPLELSATLVFPLVVLGALMDRAGGTAYVAKCALSLAGHLRGGTVHAAAISSLVGGLTSAGSTHAVIRASRETTPVMARTGVATGRAAALEVSFSANGQLIPPVMGAAIFVIADATGTGWTAVAAHALVPAAIAYVALFVMIRSEAFALNLPALPRAPSKHAPVMAYVRLAGGLALIAGGVAAAEYGRGLLRGTLPGGEAGAMWALWLLSYLVLVGFAARRPDFEQTGPDIPMPELAPFGATAVTGLYHLLPLAMFLWWIGGDGDPARGAAHAGAAMLVVAATHRPLKALFRGQTDYFGESVRRSAEDCMDGLVDAARLMVPVVIASAAAGLILGAVSLSAMGDMLGASMEWASGGRIWLFLILLALLSMILGLGLPSAAAYIVVASIAAPLDDRARRGYGIGRPGHRGPPVRVLVRRARQRPADAGSERQRGCRHPARRSSRHRRRRVGPRPPYGRTAVLLPAGSRIAADRPRAAPRAAGDCRRGLRRRRAGGGAQTASRHVKQVVGNRPACRDRRQPSRPGPLARPDRTVL